MSSTPVFDGHNDVLLRLWLKRSSSAHEDFLMGDGLGHLDLPRMQAGGMAGGMFAVFVPDPKDPAQHSTGTPSTDDDDLNPPFDPPVAQAGAWKVAQEMLSIARRVEANSDSRVRVCVDIAGIRAAMDAGALAMVLHMEGAEAIGPELEGLDQLYSQGLRSLGPVWSRPNVFGEGVPFRFPSSPDTGPGLTDAGKALVRACNDKRILVDLSHLNAKGFWDVTAISNAPLVATHSNAHAVAASSRNLTDDQLKAVAASRGLVGLNFATGFLRADGHWSAATEPEVMLRHLDHMLHLMGEDCVALGSDFDGARIPAFIKDATGVPHLVAAMRTHGYGAELMEKICWRNWLAVLERTWSA